MQGFPERNAYASSDEGERPKSPPPLEWYEGFGGFTTGINIVTYSKLLMSKEGGRVGRQLEEWEQDSNHAKGGTKEIMARAHRRIAETERFIKERLGYSPQELWARRTELERKYRGAQEAPFEVKLI